ncbi:Gfo/Idh/MocA family protein [Novipirellula artificiosorum]|uniref:Putative oxidoreductase YdgJ n=1 Tax=Novipirellula artificiosorum TaxID=2528016 RepID=A0A5C6DG26_9BACT|nr:Gfo/Idh/MocA family oxidoreductase [Novipirellula artificiosorum]TWU34934.1 putative oxidoreductase YdgJ [Novipirellula artificiosorum]
MIRVGILGLGYWGPNLVRCFSELENCKVTAVCDRDCDQLLRIKDRFPSVIPLESYDEMLERDLVDAIVIATPTDTHFDLSMKALERDLHVFVEKPLAKTSAQCRTLVETAGERNRTLFVGHVFLHSSPVKKLRELIETDELGSINYISSRRLNLGPVRTDVSALYDLAPHDISMMLYLLGQKPISVTCTGFDRLHPGIHDVCSLSMLFEGNRMGMVHVSWLDPRKERVLTVVGDKRMAVYDDLEQEKIKVFDKGVDKPANATGDFADFQLSYRYGGSYSPFIKENEPLKAECAEFIRCIVEGDVPLTDGVNGLEVVEVLEAAEQSLNRGGDRVELASLSRDDRSEQTVPEFVR